MGRIKNRVGEINYNNFGSKMVIIAYRGATDLDIYFEEYNYIVTHKNYDNFKKGHIKCPYESTVYNVGYVGEGNYSESKNKEIYRKWSSMLQRCYDKNFQEKKPAYKGCTVCKEWHNFQNFAKWYEENYYEVKGEIMHLDKDILKKNNKMYSPQNCIFAPQNINDLFAKCKKSRGDLPIGVHWCKRDKVYIAQCNYKKNRIRIGCYKKVEEAFMSYKNFKEKYIKEVADEYKDLIPMKLYEAMYKYKVEIND